MSFPSVDLTKLTVDDSGNYAEKTKSQLIFESMVAKDEQGGRLTVTFKAHLTSLSHTYSSTWNSENVFGRMDPIATFQGTVRKINVAWKILAPSLETGKQNLQAISSLTAMLYPGYQANPGRTAEGQPIPTTANSISRSPLIKLKYANLIQSTDGDGLLGWVDGFTFDQDVEAGVFIENGRHYPKAFSVNMTFNVLHQHDLGFGDDNTWLGDPVSDGKGWPFGDE